MVFGLICIALVVAVVAIHYVQGAFSSMVSAVLAILAALLAISYHEIVAEKVFASQFPGHAHALALVGLFALLYVIMRLISDNLLPGNVRLPVLADKICAAVFGTVAGIFAAGIFASAAQMFPFGASIAGYERFALKDREVRSVRVPGKSQMQDLTAYGELEADRLEAAKASGTFLLPVADMTLGLAYYLSDGSLAGDRTLASVHPSYLDELYGQRLTAGQQVLPVSEAGIQVSDIYTSASVMQMPSDFELKEIRGDREPVLPPMDGMVPVVLRTKFSGSAMSFTMSTVDLVLGGQFFNPVGSLQGGTRLLKTRLDDPLFTTGQAVDFVFVVPADSLRVEGNQKKLPDGAFLDVKRSGRCDLSGKAIAGASPGNSSDVGIKEKERKP